MQCTHIALQVRDIERSLAFYARYCGMRAVHQRGESGTRVAWVGWGEDPPQFVLVLIESAYEQNVQPRLQHIGMAVSSRAEVDRIYDLAVSDGMSDLWAPTDSGEPVGYYCAVMDPDGNRVEFSFGQRLGHNPPPYSASEGA